MRRLTHNPFFFFSLCLCAVLFSLVELWCIPFFAGLFLLLYAVLPFTAFRMKRASAVGKIKRVCKAKNYAFAVKKASRMEKFLTVKTENETFCVTLFSAYRYYRSFVTVMDEDHLVLQDVKSGTVAYATPAGGGYAMHGASVRKTNAFEFDPTSRVVKNFPARAKTMTVALKAHPDSHEDGVTKVLIVYPPACELFCKQKDEITLGCNGMRVGGLTLHTLQSFCSLISS